MKEKNYKRLKALEHAWPATKAFPSLLIVCRYHTAGGLNDWAEIDGKRMTPQEADKFIIAHQEQAKLLGYTEPYEIEFPFLPEEI